MPAASPEDIAEALIESFNESSAIAFLDSPVREQPRKLIVQGDDQAFNIWIH